MELLKRFWSEEAGVGVVELILVLVVLIGLVVIFKSELESIVSNIFNSVTSDVQQVLD